MFSVEIVMATGFQTNIEIQLSDLLTDLIASSKLTDQSKICAAV